MNSSLEQVSVYYVASQHAAHNQLPQDSAWPRVRSSGSTGLHPLFHIYIYVGWAAYILVLARTSLSMGVLSLELSLF